MYVNYVCCVHSVKQSLFVLNINYPVDDKYVNLFTMYIVYKLRLN